jgi:U3 small nucleolar RNA-associated protein 6
MNPAEEDETESKPMSNVDGLYAAEEIEPGTIIFRANDMPDLELHRSKTNPNCQVVELDDEGGELAVVSLRWIALGEYFCVAESSDEEDGSGCEDEDDAVDESEDQV